jgi:phenylpropionate dioxygenase-like ring-hydroxylating dioxygenase large terminal subunit
VNTMNDEVAQNIGALLAQRPAGRSLPRPFYADAHIFQHELENFVMRHWLCAVHESRVPEVGDYCLVEVAAESVIIVRGKDRLLRAFANVCRHRGSRICRAESGNVSAFTCPYHAWTYNLDGSLRAARDMPADFDRRLYGLRALPLRVLHGLVLFSFADAPLALDDVEENLRAICKPYGWSEAKIAHQEIYSIAANWKLAVENYVECYHCALSHPEFSRVHSNSEARSRIAELTAKVEARTAELGLAIPCMDRWGLLASPGQEATWSLRYALTRDAVTGSEDGKAVAPLMGNFRDYDGAATFFHVGPLSFFLAYPDHGVIYRFVPKAVQRCDLEVCWLVHRDAVQGVDYDVDRLTWMWRVTSDADKRIIEGNQAGVNSRYYAPGPLAVMEFLVPRFVDWYAREMASAG